MRLLGLNSTLCKKTCSILCSSEGETPTASPSFLQSSEESNREVSSFHLESMHSTISSERTCVFLAKFFRTNLVNYVIVSLTSALAAAKVLIHKLDVRCNGVFLNIRNHITR